MIEFKTSSFCNLGNCVEVGQLPDGSFVVRDTKNRAVTLTFTVEEWMAFVAGVKNDEFGGTGTGGN